MSKPISRTIDVPILARVEGEGALEIHLTDDEITTLRLKIYEPPRLFEKCLEGRSYKDVLDIVARICGICPVAYQMSASHAIEDCFGLETTPWIRTLRRLFYCGEWLESHSLHVHFLAAPDFLGFKSATEMAKQYPEEVRRGIRLQALGNELVSLLGGRSVHPVGACIGGFYKAPPLARAKDMLSRVRERLGDCEALLDWVATLPLLDNTHDFTCVSLRHPQEYPMNEGRIVSNKGLDIAVGAFDDFFVEHQVPYSNALHCLMKGEDYLVGPLARVNNNHNHLPSQIKAQLQRLGITFPSYNMHHCIIARAVEIYYGVLEAERILEAYCKGKNCSQPLVSPGDIKPGTGYGCTEAPRGLLWQSYDIDEQGLITKARIIPPTSQNQARIESDLRFSLKQFGLTNTDDALRAYGEILIRNYDPCISCSTHFLTLTVKRND